MRLIDADALLEQINRKYPEWYTEKPMDRAKHYAALVYYWAVREAPTIDAVPVIRCKDCVHYRVYQLASDGETITDCAVMQCHPPENWYCSNAERKDDD